MIKHIDNYLGDEEQRLIINYVKDLRNCYDLTGVRTSREFPDKEPLDKLYKMKHKEWMIKLNEQVPGFRSGTATIYDIIIQGQRKCCIYDFLNTLEDLLKSEKCETNHWFMLHELERGLEVCQKTHFDCPCPADD